jgi:hypothetical protein
MGTFFTAIYQIAVMCLSGLRIVLCGLGLKLLYGSAIIIMKINGCPLIAKEAHSGSTNR